MVTLLQRPATIGVRPLISEERIAAGLHLKLSLDPDPFKLVLAIGVIKGYVRKTKLVSAFAARQGFPTELQCPGELPVEHAWANSDHKYQGRTIKQDMVLTQDEIAASLRALRPEGERERPVAEAEMKKAGLSQLMVSRGARSFQPSLSMKAVYVMLLRVMLGSQIRLLPHDGDLAHLRGLQ